MRKLSETMFWNYRFQAFIGALFAAQRIACHHILLFVQQSWITHWRLTRPFHKLAAEENSASAVGLIDFATADQIVQSQWIGDRRQHRFQFIQLHVDGILYRVGRRMARHHEHANEHHTREFSIHDEKFAETN